MATQEAIFHAAGECSSIMLVSAAEPADAATREQVRRAMLERAARLMWVFEKREAPAKQYAPGNLHLLVAIKASLLGRAREFDSFPEQMNGDMGTMQRGDGSADVLIQVAAPTETERRYALRVARGVFEGHAVSTKLATELTMREVHGARVFSGLEPFGYRDGSPSEGEGLPPRLMLALQKLEADRVPEEQWVEQLKLNGLLPPTPLANPARAHKIFKRALADAKVAQRGRRHPVLPANEGEREDRRREQRAPLEALAKEDVWLLYQRYEHDLGKLAHLDPMTVVGRPPVGGDLEAPNANPNSHVGIAQADVNAGIQRRGFAYRNDAGREGLVFIGLVNDPLKFKASLELHLKKDRLLEFTSAVSSGIYLVPRSSASVVASAGLELQPEDNPIPAAAAALLRPGNPIPRLVNYQIIPEVLEYVQLARAHGLFLEPTMHLHPTFEALLTTLERELGSEKLTELRASIREQSEQLYSFNGGYFSLGI